MSKQARVPVVWQLGGPPGPEDRPRASLSRRDGAVVVTDTHGSEHPVALSGPHALVEIAAKHYVVGNDTTAAVDEILGLDADGRALFTLDNGRLDWSYQEIRHFAATMGLRFREMSTTSGQRMAERNRPRRGAVHIGEAKRAGDPGVWVALRTLAIMLALGLLLLAIIFLPSHL